MSPFQSLRGALAARPASASSTYTLLVQPGTYAAECPLDLTNVTIIGVALSPTIVCAVPSQWSIAGVVDIENVAFAGVRLVATMAQLSLTRVSIRGIKASCGGCVAAVHSYLWVDRVNCVGGRANNKGGAIYLENTAVAGRALNVSHNHARQGGGVYIGQRSHWQVSGADISSNVAQADGGGICTNDAAHVDIHSTRFYNNAADRDGGAILLAT
ncbi:hypothetical protein SPRG_05417 [Saprolegnia parasitica CBS 223.65]|uniref:Right handed beta helix domain-containing protein n=1 Tax=Saprolegnia parasitica (strain CBS 223.65) TaxID=695850 RepID=A0A067CJ47_SAPPC|nr:hypothetical protein SPRG_05417 [Saprolegnia parasitica CBS 223.65]KDO29175.1 hypothetical protein SPRG_05417 [Saprolegnia parasitica CBS 223.65]|eukprot:XP_012200052.1 hypothetical protein SPRG_05417 [Saprolegnia parasitica CBS 223.65]